MGTSKCNGNIFFTWRSVTKVFDLSKASNRGRSGKWYTISFAVVPFSLYREWPHLGHTARLSVGLYTCWHRPSSPTHPCNLTDFAPAASIIRFCVALTRGTNFVPVFSMVFCTCLVCRFENLHLCWRRSSSTVFSSAEGQIGKTRHNSRVWTTFATCSRGQMFFNVHYLSLTTAV